MTEETLKKRPGRSTTPGRVVARIPPATTAATFEPPLPDETVTKATGRGWQEWFGLLDERGAADRSHTEIARWLGAERGVASWWAQSITVGYEQARGRRAPGQYPDGWSVGATKTVAVPVERLFEAFENVALRQRWLPAGKLRQRTATAPRTARYDWEDGATRVNVTFDRKGDLRSTVALQHERLPDAIAADEMKGWWRDRLAALKRLLEGGGAAP